MKIIKLQRLIKLRQVNRHCERSEAIHVLDGLKSGLPRCARNDGGVFIATYLMKIIKLIKKIFFSPLGVRMSKSERNESRGVAIILVLISLAVVTAIVVDLGYNETIRYKLAIRTRDSVKAEALAAGGLNWARLFLTVQDKLQTFLSDARKLGISIPIDTPWEVPISSDMLKGFVNGSIAKSIGLELKEPPEKKAVETGDGELKKAKKGFEKPKGGFGNFDGSFVVQMSDEESKISLQDLASKTDANKTKRIRRLLGSLIAPKRYDSLFENNVGNNDSVDRASLIANINDWIDADDIRTDPGDQSENWGKTGSSSEKEVYSLDKGLIPKNAYFDSLAELRLVHGVTDEIDHAFFDSLTIYGQEGKINILSAKDQVVEAVMRYCASEGEALAENTVFSNEVLKKWKDYGLNGQGEMSVKGFTDFLAKQGLSIDQKICEEFLDVKSKTFTMISKATVGKSPNEVTRTLTLVARVVDNAVEMNYFRSK